jgi:NADP-dependent 3-hydroxy acid dehydrogenase YdfG
VSIEGAGGLHIVLTGASSGIGEATARVLAGAGHRLVLAARRAELLEALVKDLNPSGKRVIGVVCDVTKPEDLERLVTRANAEFGQIQVLVNNAGVDSGGQKWWTAGADEVHKVLSTNLEAVFSLTRLVLPDMLQARNGHIINVGSVAGRLAVSSLYSASKFGVRGMSLALRRELLGTGVNVSLVAPGFIRTAMTAKGGKRPLPMPGPEVVGHAILGLLERPRPEVIVPGYYRLLCWLETLVPAFGDAVVQRSWKREP